MDNIKKQADIEKIMIKKSLEIEEMRFRIRIDTLRKLIKDIIKNKVFIDFVTTAKVMRDLLDLEEKLHYKHFISICKIKERSTINKLIKYKVNPYILSFNTDLYKSILKFIYKIATLAVTYGLSEMKIRIWRELTSERGKNPNVY